MTSVLAGCATGWATGCAAADCPTCPTATLTANGSTDVVAAVGDQITYAWSSTNADTASSTVTIMPTADACGNKNGPWVVSTLEGTTSPLPLLACQSGFTYELEMTVTQKSSGTTATSTATIVVR